MPEEFLENKLKNLIDFRSGYTWGKEQESSNPLKGSVRVLTVSNIQQELDLSSELYLMNVPEKEKVEKKAERGWSIAVGSNGNRKRIGNAIYINNDDEYLFASFLVGFKPKPESGLHPRYFYQWLTSYPVQERITVVSEGTTGLGNLNIRHFRNMRIRYPKKYSEQESIVKIFETLDETLKATQNSIAQAQQLKKALMQHLLSGRLKPDGTWRTPDEFYINDRVGKVPKDWCVYRMAELGKFYGGATPSTQQQAYWNGNIYWLVPSDISSFGDDEIIIQETADKITELGLASCSATMLPQGSVSMSSRATLGDCGILGKNMCTNQGFINIVCNEKIINTYLLFWIRQNKRYISRYAAGTTFLEIGRRQFKKLRLAIPEVDEQKKIIDLLTGVDNLLKGKRDKISKLISLKKALMQNLLTGKIRVQVG